MKLRTRSVPVYEFGKPPRLVTAAVVDSGTAMVALEAWKPDVQKQIRRGLLAEHEAERATEAKADK